MIRRVRVALEPAYTVCIGAGAFEHAARRLGSRDVVVRDGGLPDERGQLGAARTIVLPAGEAAKDWRGLDLVLGSMAREELDRTTTVFVVGGGAALDVGGLAAALYMRGVDAVYCPTTLLAMVDASVGGKTAINLRAGKNLAGVVRQPRAVFADVGFLESLSEAEFRSGLGEALKTALLGGEAFLAHLERAAPRLVRRDPAALTELIARCVRLKARVVERDPLDVGERRALNLGHTFAHAIEHVAGYGRIPHGVAVAVGLALALELARARGLLRDARLPARVARLATRLGLPSALDALRDEFDAALPAGKLLAAMRRDKKSLAARPRFVLPVRAGQVECGVECDAELVATLLAPQVKRAPRTARPKRA